MPESSPLPPVRLRPEAELARAALAAPLLARAARLARWADGTTRVGAGGELVEEQLTAAAAELGLIAEGAEEAELSDARAYASEAWRIAVDCGFVEVTDEQEGTVARGEALARLVAGSPRDVLELWLAALDAVLADAGAPALDDLAEALAQGGTLDLAELDWDPEAEADFLDAVLGNLYLLTAGEDAPEPTPVPLPALAASVLVPEGMEQPTDEVLEEVSQAMVRLDEQFRLIEPIGLVEFRPVDEALLFEEPAGAPAVDESDVTRYGMVRLTPLGLYGLRARLAEAGLAAPVVGELAAKGADALLDGTSGYPESAAQSELEQWLAGRQSLDAARELLAAARGTDQGAPLRRLRCQQALSLVEQSAEPALREVLDDAELGGLARVWLAEHGARDVPPPSEAMIFWLTVDTLAAQLAAAGNSPELQSLVEGLAAQHSGFFDTAWRVEHPATAEVLEAMGRLHPDKKVAKQARTAAFKARSQHGM